MTDSVLCLNACSTPLKWITWQRAVCMVVADQADIIESVDDKFVHSAYLTVPMPATIQLRAYVYVAWAKLYGGDPVNKATRRAILARDRNVCLYCGDRASTIDHVLPRSSGGGNTWLNLVAACLSCNQKKGNRTPDGAGMRLLWQPFVPDRQKELERSAKERHSVLSRDYS